MGRAVRWAVCAAWVLTLSGAAAAGAADEAGGDVPAALEALAPLVGGEWTIDGKWMNGEALKAREKFEWGLNRKFITCRTWVSNNDGTGEYERYQAVFAAKDGKPVLYNFSHNGDSSVDEVKVNGKVLDIRRKVVSTQGETTIRQEIELTGKDTFRWRIWLDRDGESRQIMDGEWVRKAS